MGAAKIIAQGSGASLVGSKKAAVMSCEILIPPLANVVAAASISPRRYRKQRLLCSLLVGLIGFLPRFLLLPKLRLLLRSF